MAGRCAKAVKTLGPWFRVYVSILDDPKLARLTDAQYRFNSKMLALAKFYDGAVPCAVGDIAFRLRMPEGRVRDTLQVLVSAELLDFDGYFYRPHNWNERQFVDPDGSSSIERVRRHREKRRAAGLSGQWQATDRLRETIYARDGYACIYCGAEDDLTLDHKIPEIRGGDHDEDNLATACRKCNASKRDLTSDEFVTRRGTVTVTVTPVTLPYTEAETDSEAKTEAKAESSSLRSESSDAAQSDMPIPEFLDRRPRTKTNRLNGHKPDFQAFYDVFPSHIAPRAAEKAYVSALKRASPEIILAGAIRYRDNPKRDPEFTKRPATWLNADCWLDETQPTDTGAMTEHQRILARIQGTTNG